MVMHESVSGNYDPTPKAYVNPSLTGYTMAPERQAELATAVGDKFRGTTSKELLQTPMSIEERLLLDSMYRFIDYCIANRITTKNTENSSVRISRAISTNLRSFELPDQDIDDLRQEARLATIIQLRRFDPERAGQPTTVLPLAISSRLQSNGARALSRGTVGHKGRGANIGSLSDVRRSVLSASSEGGWSDDLQQMYSHPYYIDHVPLLFEPEPEEAYDEYGTRYTIPEFQPIVPEQDIADPQPFALVNEADLADKLDRFFAVADKYITLTDKQIELLRMRYEEALGYRKIGERNGYSHQAAQQNHDKIIEKIATVPALMEALRDLVT